MPTNAELTQKVNETTARMEADTTVAEAFDELFISLKAQIAELLAGQPALATSVDSLIAAYAKQSQAIADAAVAGTLSEPTP